MTNEDFSIADFLVARVLGGGSEAPWTLRTPAPRVPADVYATLSRKVRRDIRAQQRPIEAVVPTQTPRRMSDGLPQRAAPTSFLWWKRPFEVGAHLFSTCPRLFREWAGYDFRAVRTGSARQAQRHTQGLCQHCLLRWQIGYTA